MENEALLEALQGNIYGYLYEQVICLRVVLRFCFATSRKIGNVC